MVEEKHINDDETLRSEARILSYYLIKEYPREKEIAFYVNAVEKLQFTLENKSDRKILELIIKSPWMLGIFDAGLGLVNPESMIRKKIVVMLAILEASPLYCHKFLSVPFKKLHLLVIGQKVFFSVLKSILGFVVVKTYSVLWR